MGSWQFRHMCVFKNGAFYHYEFTLDGRRHRGSTGTADRDEAVREESRQRERLEKSYGQVVEEEARQQRRKTIQEAADAFLVEYRSEERRVGKECRFRRDGSSDVCSSDLAGALGENLGSGRRGGSPPAAAKDDPGGGGRFPGRIHGEARMGHVRGLGAR